MPAVLILLSWQCGMDGQWMPKHSPAMPKKRPRLPDAFREYLRALGAKGGKAAAGRGGKARFSVMTPAERSALARKAARARWAKARKKRTS